MYLINFFVCLTVFLNDEFAKNKYQYVEISQKA